jgi:hypothetical protein
VVAFSFTLSPAQKLRGPDAVSETGTGVVIKITDAADVAVQPEELVIFTV